MPTMRPGVRKISYFWMILLAFCLAWSRSFADARNVASFSGKLQSKLKVVRGGATTNGKLGNSPPLAITSAHWMSVDDCLQSLQVVDGSGLSSLEAALRLQHYGPNELKEPAKKAWYMMVLEQFQDRLVQILLAVATISGVLAMFDSDPHALTEPLVIACILVLNALVGIWQSRSAENSLEALKKLQPQFATVLRDGQWLNNFSTSSLVPGDIIYLRVGDRVPADARVMYLKTGSLTADEASLTGEATGQQKGPEPVAVNAPLTAKSDILFSGTLITGGACHAVIVATGAATEIGSINEGVSAAKEDHANVRTPLAQQLDAFAADLTKLIGGICVLVWLLSIPRFGAAAFSSWTAGALYHAKTAVALGVAAIPEGLPAVITLCLSLGTRRLAKKNVIIRRLQSVETLGSVTVICTDKTGTLTTNSMTATALLTLAAGNSQSSSQSSSFVERSVSGISYDPALGVVDGLDSYHHRGSSTPDAMQWTEGISALCNEAALKLLPPSGANDPATVGFIGEPTEAALLVLAEKLHTRLDPSSSTSSQAVVEGENNEKRLRRATDRWLAMTERLFLLEFSRDRKAMSVLVQGRDTQSQESAGPLKAGEKALLVKGAAELLLNKCSYILNEAGKRIPLTPTLRLELESQLRELAQRPLRCLALAYKTDAELPSELRSLRNPEEATMSPLLRDHSQYAELETGLTLAAVVGIRDPARPEAGMAIAKCRAAGIRVFMITGDSKDTAVAIAKEVGILDQSQPFVAADSAFSGREFFAMPQDEQLRVLQQGNKVFCRAEPRDKQRLVSMLQDQLGEVVAMTGDGVNDAPALQQAEIGIAMGIAGTEVAKGAADMILADDRFDTIVRAAEEGRHIFAAMQSFVTFLISCNLGEIAVLFFATLIGIPEPLTPLHLLWVNLVTDGPPATALGFNPPDPKAMLRPPRDRRQPLLNKWQLFRYGMTGLYVGVATLVAFTWYYLDKGVSLFDLRRWDSCHDWAPLEGFLHSADAPNLPLDPCGIFSGGHLRQAQAVALSVLVAVELLKAVAAVSLEESIFRVPPWRNRFLLPGVTLPLLLHLAVLYVPALSKLFGLAPLKLREWKMVLVCALPIVLIEEGFKAISRRRRKVQQQKAKLQQPEYRSSA